MDSCSSRSLNLAVAESCTGGLISSKITDVPGASGCFIGGFIVYSNELKSKVLGVKESTLKVHGAVSRECAGEMLIGLEERFDATVSLSVTGIAGPTGGTEEKPVGTVYIGVKLKREDPHVEGFMLKGLEREVFKEEVSIRALGMLLGHIRG